MSTSALTEMVFAEIIAQNGGRVYRVGGCVRDSFMGRTAKDVEFSITGMVKKNFKILFPQAEDCSKPVPVFHLVIDGVKREVAFARTERKVGSGCKEFKVSAKPKITIEEDLFRRDITINSMACDVLTGEIIDPFHGREDIKAKVLRANGQHFSDDPIRALRLAGQAARFGFSIDRDTRPLVVAAQEELSHEPAGRMAAELAVVLSEAQEPGRFFKILAETNLLQVTFKEIAALSTGEFARVMDGLDSVAKAAQNAKIRFATLGLVLDKKRLDAWNDRMKLPGGWLDAAVTVNQTIDFLEKPTAEKLADTINKLWRGSLTVEEFDLVTKAAGLKIPQLGPMKALMALPPGEVVPATLQGKEIGEWLREKHVEAIEKHLLSGN